MHAKIIAGAIMALAGSANAELFNFSGLLLPSSEVPPIDSPANGSFAGVLDTDTGTFTFSWEVEDLLGAPAAPGAHIHVGGPDENGPIVFFISDAEWDLSGTATWSGLGQEQFDTFLAGGYYFNFHTDQFPGGEVRGQIVPAPAAVAPLLGFGAVVARRRR